MILWTILVVIVTYIIVQNYKNINYWKKKNIKFIKPWPLLGSFGATFIKRTSMVEQFESIYYAYPDAKFVGLHQVNKPVLMLRDPELIKQVTVKHFDSFTNHTVIFTEDIEPLFGKSIVSLEGDRWRHMRATLSPAFTGSKMRAMCILINECAEQFAKHFMEVKKQNGVVSVEMKDIFTKYTNDVIATSAFGIKCNSLENEHNEFYSMGKKITNFGLKTNLKFFAYMLIPSIMKFMKIGLFGEEFNNFFNDIVKTTIETREKEGIIRPDMIHLLMEARKGNLKHEIHDEDAGFATVEESEIGKIENAEKPELTLEDITAQAALFFMAGYDTSSTLMCFLAHELAIHSEIQKKLQQEIDETFEKCHGKIDYESLLKMKYLDMVISEALRYWPPAAITERLCNNPFTFTDGSESVTVDKEHSVWIPVYPLHHDPKYFSNPEKFDPERFNDENKNNIQPFTYMPFGAGPRNCIGSRFALLEVKALFVHLLYKFDLVVTEKTQVPLKLMKGEFAMKAEKGFWLGLKPR